MAPERVGLRIGAVNLPRQTQSIVDLPSYLPVIARDLSDLLPVVLGYWELAPDI